MILRHVSTLKVDRAQGKEFTYLLHRYYLFGFIKVYQYNQFVSVS